MGHRTLDLSSYPRKDHFEYFNSLSYPYVGLTVNIEITNFIHKIKEHNLPFFLSFCYCAAQAANQLPEFRQRIVNNEIIEFDWCQTSHTVALEDGTYCYCTLDCHKPFVEYLPYAIQKQEYAKLSKTTTDSSEEVDELIFISTLPWLSYTAFIQPVPMPADSNPRITWGKYFEQNSTLWIPVSVLCNHALVDGLHISQFYQALEQQLQEVAAIMDTF